MSRLKKNKYPPTETPRENEGQPVKIKHQLKPRGLSQSMYLESLRETPVTIAAGPAGCGKTYLVTAVAIEKLLSGAVDKIVLTRPVVEAGENLGFLPGTLEEKLDPYLLPLKDALEDHIGPAATKRLFESGKIEIAPLAFMRGRTFNKSIVILDEAQNSTVEQMRMFVTRMGYESTFCINGDITQSDLVPPNNINAMRWENGLQFIIRKLTGRDPKINYIEFRNKDVVRSEMVKRMLNLLDAPDDRTASNDADSSGSNGARALITR